MPAWEAKVLPDSDSRGATEIQRSGPTASWGRRSACPGRFPPSPAPCPHALRAVPVQTCSPPPHLDDRQTDMALGEQVGGAITARQEKTSTRLRRKDREENKRNKQKEAREERKYTCLQRRFTGGGASSPEGSLYPHRVDEAFPSSPPSLLPSPCPSPRRPPPWGTEAREDEAREAFGTRTKGVEERTRWRAQDPGPPCRRRGAATHSTLRNLPLALHSVAFPETSVCVGRASCPWPSHVSSEVDATHPWPSTARPISMPGCLLSRDAPRARGRHVTALPAPHVGDEFLVHGSAQSRCQAG